MKANDDKKFRENLKRVQNQFNAELQNGNIPVSDDLVLFGLGKKDIATLKEVFEDAKLKTTFCHENDKYDKYCNLYKAIYLQVKADKHFNS